MLGQLAVLSAGGATEPVERQAEASADVALQVMLLIARAAHIESRFERAKLGRGTVLVGRADEQHLVSLHPPKPCMHARRQHRAGKIAEMLDAVDVRQGGCDQVTAHHSLWTGEEGTQATLVARAPRQEKSYRPEIRSHQSGTVAGDPRANVVTIRGQIRRWIASRTPSCALVKTIPAHRLPGRSPPSRRC